MESYSNKKRPLCGTVIRRFAAALVAFAVAFGPLPYNNAASASGKAGRPRVVARASDSDVYAACIFVGVGQAFEPDGSGGMTGMLNSVILNGGGLSPSDAPAFAIEALGGRVDSVTASEYVCFRLSAPSEGFGEALDMLAGALCNPNITKYSVEKARQAVLASSDMDTDSPETGAYMAFLEKTYEGTPYANAGRGGSDAVYEIGSEELSVWHDKYYGTGGLVVSVSAGDSPGAAAAFAEHAFGRYVDDTVAVGPGQDSIADAPVVRTQRYESEGVAGGSAAMLGYTAPPVGSPDFAAVKLAEAVVADGMGSKLFKTLRGEDRLAYSFGSILPEANRTSRLAFYVSADEEKIENAVEAVRDSVEDLKRGALSDDELDRARASLIGSLRGGSADPEESAWNGGLYELMGLGPDYAQRLEDEIRDLDADDVREVANRYMNEYTLVIIKPESRIR